MPVKRVLELGTYVRYSSLVMAKALAGTDFHIYSVEFSPFNASIARRVIQHAGQEHRITVVEGCLGDGGLTLDRLSKEFGCDGVDFVFVDHAKEAYLSDLKLMLERKWLREGTRILADNMLLPGAPSYFCLCPQERICFQLKGTTPQWNTKHCFLI